MFSIGRDLAHNEHDLEGTRFHGVVIDNKDPNMTQGLKLRTPAHEGIDDEDLPWVHPHQANMAGNAGGGTGELGTIPPIGAKVHMSHPDGTMYNAVYHGTVTTKDAKVKDLTQGDYGKNYPHVQGSVDPSGNLHAKDNEFDTVENTHVSGTSHQVDGKGNVNYVINGDAKTNNPKAKKKFPKGGSMTIHGDGTITISGNCSISATGNVSISCNGNAAVSAKGKASLTSGSSVSISGKSVAISTSGSNPGTVKKPSDVTPRARPTPANPSNQSA
jgi:hypothetical protein